MRHRLKQTAIAALSSLAILVPALAAQPKAVTFDFESGDLQGFRIAEGAFDKIINDADMCRNTPEVRRNKQGKYYLATIELRDGGYNDAMTGVMESPVFVLSGPRISFLVGGGAHPDTYVALCSVTGEELMRASGSNAELMTRIEWNAKQYVGKRVYLSIVDRNTGSWGHVTFDDFHADGTIDADATAHMSQTYAARQAAAREKAAEAAARYEARRAERLQKLKSDAGLLARGSTAVYSGDNLSAVMFPTGGIGAGNIQLDGTARRAVWQIFNNFSQSFIPDSFFAVRATTNGGPSVTRLLETRSDGPIAGVRSLQFRGEYPFGWYTFRDDDLPVQVEMETYTPFIPTDAKNSAIPCAVYTFTLRNTGDTPVDVSLLATQQNAVGFTGSNTVTGVACRDYGGNANRVVRSGSTVSLLMTGRPGAGDMALVAFEPDAVGSASIGDATSAMRGFRERGSLPSLDSSHPTPAGRTADGALAVPFRLAPGQVRTVRFALTWYFPNGRHGAGEWGGEGNMYTNWWSSALDVAGYLAAHLQELDAKTRLYHDTLYQTNLPYYVLDRISAQADLLRSKTCFWTKAGYFGGWEGVGENGGSCAGNCTHVWQYAQLHARLFPEIGRLMREEELGFQTPDGGIPHRQLTGHWAALDGECGAILGTYREHLLSADDAWLRRWWPNARRAMEHAIATWDVDEDGVLSGPQWNTLDTTISGSSTWLGGLYLAALAASQRMADLMGEPQLASRYARILESGSRLQDTSLFNGEYYIQKPDERLEHEYTTGCHMDQLLGQWWANQLDLGPLYPNDHVRSALDSIVKYNFRADQWGIQQLPRKFASDDDPGLVLTTWPHGGRPETANCLLYVDEIWTSTEYTVAASLLAEGKINDALLLIRAAADRHDGRLRTDLTPGDWSCWGYSGNPYCDEECGKFYARPMSVWSILLAAQGFIYDGPAGVIGFRPIWKPDDHRSVFTTAAGWGLFTQRRSGDRQTERIELRYGTLTLRTLAFERTSAQESRVTVGGREIGHTVESSKSKVTIRLKDPLTLRAGDTIEIDFH